MDPQQIHSQALAFGFPEEIAHRISSRKLAIQYFELHKEVWAALNNPSGFKPSSVHGSPNTNGKGKDAVVYVMKTLRSHITAVSGGHNDRRWFRDPSAATKWLDSVAHDASPGLTVAKSTAKFSVPVAMTIKQLARLDREDGVADISKAVTEDWSKAKFTQCPSHVAKDGYYVPPTPERSAVSLLQMPPTTIRAGATDFLKYKSKGW